MSRKRYCANGISLLQHSFDLLSLANDGQWHEFGKYQSRTLKALIAKDLLVISLADKGLPTQYRITGRGKTFLATIANRTPTRKDGRCPHCNGANDRHVNGNGAKMRYCLECWKIVRANPRKTIRKSLCAHCKANLRAKFKDGSWDSYCKECRTAINRTTLRKWRLSKVQQAHNGDVALCPECGINPRKVSKKTVASLCQECKQSSDRTRYLRLKHEAFERRIKS